MEEPTVQVHRRLRRNRKRGPKAQPVVTVRVDDHQDGTVSASFASPDGVRWATFAYWPKSDEPRESFLVDFSGDEPRVVGRVQPD